MFVLYLERQMPNNGENIVCYGNNVDLLVGNEKFKA
jgi:hypothetical protein